MWYHDHALGITRTNAYAGIASAYVLMDGFEAAGGQPGGFNSLGVPVVGGARYFPSSSRTRSSSAPPFAWTPPGRRLAPAPVGSLWYAHTYDPKLLQAGGQQEGHRLRPRPLVVPEFFGDTMLANGTVYPEVTVEARRYRFQILNACNARFLNLQLYVDERHQHRRHHPGPADPGSRSRHWHRVPQLHAAGHRRRPAASPVIVPSNMPFNPLTLAGSLILGAAERADCIIDFSGALRARKLILYTDAPAPFPVGAPIFDYLPNGTRGGPNTREIMRFNVVRGRRLRSAAGRLSPT